MVLTSEGELVNRLIGQQATRKLESTPGVRRTYALRLLRRAHNFSDQVRHRSQPQTCRVEGTVGQLAQE